MNERQKIILIVSLLLAVIGLVIIIFLPSKSETRTLDFYIQDANGNNHLEVNEKLRFLVNDSSEVSDKTVLWKMGNGDSIVGHPNINYKYRKAGKYLVTLHIDGRYITGRYIQRKSCRRFHSAYSRCIGRLSGRRPRLFSRRERSRYMALGVRRERYCRCF